MMYTATVTSKRQITLPAKLFADLGLATGHKLKIVKSGDRLIVTSQLSELYGLMGLVRRPVKYAKMNVDTMIEQSKESYFKNKKT